MSPATLEKTKLDDFFDTLHLRNSITEMGKEYSATPQQSSAMSSNTAKSNESAARSSHDSIYDVTDPSPAASSKTLKNKRKKDAQKRKKAEGKQREDEEKKLLSDLRSIKISELANAEEERENPTKPGKKMQTRAELLAHVEESLDSSSVIRQSKKGQFLSDIAKFRNEPGIPKEIIGGLDRVDEIMKAMSPEQRKGVTVMYKGASLKDVMMWEAMGSGKEKETETEMETENGGGDEESGMFEKRVKMETMDGYDRI